MIQSHIKVTKKKLMHGGSKWFQKGYIMIFRVAWKRL